MFLLGLLSLPSSARPPFQTAVQKSVYEAHAAKAQACSDGAKPGLLAALSDPGFKQAISGVPILAKKNSTELLEMLYQEIHYAFMIHNGYAGVSLQQVQQLGYLPTGWDTVCEGLRPYDPNMANQNANEVQGMGFPDMPMPPPKPQCYDRAVYTGVNIWKQSGGQLQFTPVGFVADLTEDQSAFISPIDTGSIGPGPTSQICFGTVHHFYHLVLAHLQHWGATLQQLFLRWYGKGPLPQFFCRYFESEFSATFLLPERLLVMTVSFSLFGDAGGGKALTDWARSTLHRPLMWADPADSGGSILDAYVNHIEGYNITKFDEGVYWGLWDGKAPWPTFRNKTSSEMQVHLLGYENHEKCDPSKCKKCHFVGVNHEDKCLYWR